MRTLIITSWLGLITPVLSYAAGDTNEFTLFTSRANGQKKTEWRISESRILAAPEWNPGAKSIPLSPDRAWLIAKERCLKQGFGEPELAGLSLKPLHTPRLRTDVGSRFYYDIKCHNPAHPNFMTVVVLMDGTVLEPRPVDEPSEATR